MRIIIICCLLCISTVARGQNVPFRLKTTAQGVELLVLPANPEQMRMGVAAGYRIEKKSNGGNWQLVNDTPLQPGFIKALPDQMSKSEKVLYQKFSPEAYQESYAQDPRYTKAIQGFHDLVISNLPASREGLKRSGLWLIDPSGRAGQTYRVRIWTNEVARGNVTMVAALPHGPLPSPTVIGSPNGFDQQLLLQWDYLDRPVAYWLEKSVDGRAFERTTTYLLVEQSSASIPEAYRDKIIQRDSIPIDGKTYRFRASSVDLFGEVSEPGPIYQIIGQDLRAPAMPKLATPTVNAKTGEIELNWSVEQTGLAAQRYELSAANTIDGNYRPIATYPAAATKALLLRQSYQNVLNGGNSVYFQVSAIGANGMETPSVRVAAFLPDDTAPAVPSLSAAVDTNGIVRLSWPEKRPEDLHRYSIRRRAQRQDGFVEIYYGLPAKNALNDTLDLELGRGQVTYSISAIDRVGNRSAYSSPIRLQLPDRVAPPSPCLRTFSGLKDSLLLVWDAVSSTDLANYVLEIQTGERAFRPWKTTNKQATYILSGGHEPSDYRIRIAAIDSSGNQSEWVTTPLVRLSKPSTPPSIETVQSLRLEADGKTQILRWESGKTGDQYYVFVRIGDVERLLQATESNRLSLPLNLASGSQLYVLRERDGRVAEPSEIISL